MFQTILVPLDGSALAERAIAYAEILARSASGRIVFVRAVPYGPGFRPEGATSEDHAQGHVGEAESYLADVIALATAADVKTEHIVQQGDPAKVIFQAIDDVDADMVVMSTHGRGAIGRALCGSVADAVLRGAPVPVLLVPQVADATWWDRAPIRLLVPLDGSEFAEQALPFATELTRTLNGSMVLVRAAGYEVDLALAGAFGDKREAANTYLKAVAARLKAVDVEATVEVQEALPIRAILQVADKYQAQGVVMATHGRVGAARLLLGSTTDATVHASRLAVLVIPPGAAGRRTTSPESLAS